jgi:hypothetical protein
LEVITAEETKQQEGDADQTSQAQREQCGVFTQCKICNIETHSRDYATVDEAVFSPSRERVAHRVASPRLVCRQATATNTWMTQE